MDDPQRDEIVAREMGWPRPTDKADGDWTDEFESMLEGEEAEESVKEEADSPFESFEQHSLYRAAFNLTIWIDQLFDGSPALQSDPAAVKLATHTALAAAKLAAALSDEDAEELGMSIAYLKRALKAITVAMDGAAQLVAETAIDPSQYAALQQRLFQVRDGIISLMGEFRGEWRRRFGSEGFRS
jgi:hypothetical protein